MSYNLSLMILYRCICTTDFCFNTCSKQYEEFQAFPQCIEYEDLTRQYKQDNMNSLYKDGYHKSNLKKCSQYDLICRTCINQSEHCLTCESTNYRIKNNSNQCLNQDGYYDIGIEMCQKCNQICKTCKVNSSKCFSCYEIQNYRQLNLNQCICQKDSYDNGQLICENKQQNYYYYRMFQLMSYMLIKNCDINENRIDQSAIKRCSRLSGFYQNENENYSSMINRMSFQILYLFYIKRQLYNLFYFQNIKQIINIQQLYLQRWLFCKLIVKNVVSVVNNVIINQIIVQVVLVILEIHLLYLIANLDSLKTLYKIVSLYHYLLNIQPVKINAKPVKNLVLIVQLVNKVNILNYMYVKMDIMKVDILIVFNLNINVQILLQTVQIVKVIVQNYLNVYVQMDSIMILAEVKIQHVIKQLFLILTIHGVQLVNLLLYKRDSLMICFPSLLNLISYQILNTFNLNSNIIFVFKYQMKLHLICLVLIPFNNLKLYPENYQTFIQINLDIQILKIKQIYSYLIKYQILLIISIQYYLMIYQNIYQILVMKILNHQYLKQTMNFRNLIGIINGNLEAFFNYKQDYNYQKNLLHFKHSSNNLVLHSIFNFKILYHNYSNSFRQIFYYIFDLKKTLFYF
ncbi:unnamed protein product [Paramecium sonneborni]|uniref:Transmembrane protein n=1 Tax=Paramecium sonneborni TaxID=65129 RepID=A0A8S1R2T0_9CILI|nr:unnamed protein product [Paramecium sonneborni]